MYCLNIASILFVNLLELSLYDTDYVAFVAMMNLGAPVRRCVDLTSLKLKDLILLQLCTFSLLDVLEHAEYMEIDIPGIWLYLGQVTGPMVQDGSVPLNFLRSAVRPLSPLKAGQLLGEVLHDAATRLVSCLSFCCKKKELKLCIAYEGVYAEKIWFSVYHNT